MRRRNTFISMALTAAIALTAVVPASALSLSTYKRKDLGSGKYIEAGFSDGFSVNSAKTRLTIDNGYSWSMYCISQTACRNGTYGVPDTAITMIDKYIITGTSLSLGSCTFGGETATCTYNVNKTYAEAIVDNVASSNSKGYINFAHSGKVLTGDRIDKYQRHTTNSTRISGQPRAVEAYTYRWL